MDKDKFSRDRAFLFNVVGVGDIIIIAWTEDEAESKLLKSLPNSIFTVINAYKLLK